MTGQRALRLLAGAAAVVVAAGSIAGSEEIAVAHSPIQVSQPPSGQQESARDKLHEMIDGLTRLDPGTGIYTYTHFVRSPSQEVEIWRAADGSGVTRTDGVLEIHGAHGIPGTVANPGARPEVLAGQLER